MDNDPHQRSTMYGVVANVKPYRYTNSRTVLLHHTCCHYMCEDHDQIFFFSEDVP